MKSWTSFSSLTSPIARSALHLVASKSIGPTAISLLRDGKLDTLALGQTYPWLLAADDEDIAFPGSELVVHGVLDVDNVETTVVTFSVSDHTNTAHVTTTSDHSDHTSVELDEVGDLASRKVNLNCVVDLDGWVGVTNRSCIVRNQEWDSALAQLHPLDLAKLVFRLLACDAVYRETALGVVNQPEALASLLN